MFSLSKAMSVIPVGFTYATYGGLTITAIALFGMIKYNQPKYLWIFRYIFDCNWSNPDQYTWKGQIKNYFATGLSNFKKFLCNFLFDEHSM